MKPRVNSKSPKSAKTGCIPVFPVIPTSSVMVVDMRTNPPIVSLPLDALLAMLGLIPAKLPEKKRTKRSKQHKTAGSSGSSKTSA